MTASADSEAVRETLKLLVTRIQLDMRCGTLPPEWGGGVFERARDIAAASLTSNTGWRDKIRDEALDEAAEIAEHVAASHVALAVGDPSQQATTATFIAQQIRGMKHG